MTSTENNNLPRLPPNGEIRGMQVPHPLSIDLGGERSRSNLVERPSEHSTSVSAVWTTAVRTAAEESWIRQSSAMPSASIEISGVATSNSSLSGTIETSGRDEANESTSVPHHRREGSLESITGLLNPTRTQWPNGDSGIIDPMAFTTSFSATEEDTLGIPSDIHDAARIFNWERVGQLCDTNPEAAAYIGEDGWTALHHACSRRCPDRNVMESLIQAYPDALLITEDKGWTPLHYACRFKAPKDVVQLLLHMYPEKGRVGVSRPDRLGRLPLYYAVRYSAPSGVVSLLLEMDPSAVLEEDQNADSPLALTWDDWAEKTGGRRVIRNILVGEEVTENSEVLMNSISMIDFESSRTEDFSEKATVVRRRLQRQTDALERWNKVNTFLKAAFGFPLDEARNLENDDTRLEEPKWRVLHAVSAIKCHSSLFLLAICLHPEQAFEMDKNDLRRIDNIYKSEDCNETNPLNITALHFAASSHASGDSGKMIVTQLLALNPTAARCVDSEGSTPLHRISGNKSKQDWNLDAIENIYSCYKDAKTMIDSNGRLPLHRASNAITYFHSNIHDDTVISRSKICRLLHEHVDAASHPDHFGCLPIHLVAQNGRSWDVQVQSIYEANTSGVRVRTGVKLFNRLPLHIAAANGNSDLSMIRTLLKYNPLGASQEDRKGLFALHLACESGHPWEIVNAIHKAFPDAVEQAEHNSRGWNALHMAAYSNHSDGELLSELVKLYPNAASVCDNDGRYPLHLACMSGKVWEDGLSCLFEANANAIRCRDKKGLLPLHIIAFRYCSKPPAVCDSSPQITNRSSRRSKSLITSDFDALDKNEKKEAQELSNIFEILKSDPTALLL